MNEEIKGYIPQTETQIGCINDFKQLEIDLIKIVDMYWDQGAPEVDKRWMSVAKTHFQQGFMAAVRAVARPKGD